MNSAANWAFHEKLSWNIDVPREFQSSECDSEWLTRFVKSVSSFQLDPASIKQSGFVEKFLARLKEERPQSSDDLHATAKCVFEDLSSSCVDDSSAFGLFTELSGLTSLCLQIFLQCNWTGPEPSGSSTSATLLELFPSEFLEIDDAKSCPLRESVWAAMACDGEVMQEKIQGLCFLFLCKTFSFDFFSSSKWTSVSESSPLWHIFAIFSTLWRSRVAAVWQRSTAACRTSWCPHLMKIAVHDLFKMMKTYQMLPPNLVELDEYFMSEEHPVDEWPFGSEIRNDLSLTSRIRLCLELATNVSAHGKSELFREILTYCSSLLGYDLHLTGAMGRKRAFQTDAAVQLVLKASKEYSSNNSRLVSQSLQQNVTPVSVSMDEVISNNDLLDRPKLLDSELKSDLEDKLPINVQLLVLSWASLVLSTSPPADELAMEEVDVLSNRCLITNNQSISVNSESVLQNFENRPEHIESIDWLVFSWALWLRSSAEFNRLKKQERACLQMNTLVDQFNDKEPPANLRLQFVHQLDYPNRWEMTRSLAFKLMRVGAALSAHKMCAALGLWDEAVECLVVAGRKNAAWDLLESQLTRKETPRLLCVAGDIKRDPSYYERAWNLSGGRYARAARGMGRYLFENRNLQSASEWYTKSVAINPTNAGAWFTLGCAQLTTGDSSGALASFNRVVGLESENGEAWANMAAAHVKLDNFLSAENCIDRAVKVSRTNWRFWDTKLKMGAKLGHLEGVCESLDNLMELEKTSNIEIWMLKCLVALTLQKKDKEEENAIMKDYAVDRSCKLMNKYMLKYSSVFSCDAIPITDAAERFRNAAVLFQLTQKFDDALEFRFKENKQIQKTLVDFLTTGPNENQKKRNINEWDELTGLLKYFAETINGTLSLIRTTGMPIRLEKISLALSIWEGLESKLESTLVKGVGVGVPVENLDALKLSMKEMMQDAFSMLKKMAEQ